MAGSILQAASQISPSAKARLKGVTGQTYSPVGQSVKQTGSDLWEAISKFVGSATEAYGTYDKYKKETASKNVDQILRTMSPQQIQDARQKGLLLAQDDPYTTAALNSKLGSMESDRIYSEGMQKIAAGHFKNRDEYSQWMSQRTQQAQQSMAEAYSIDPQDQHWKSGWNEDADVKNIAVYRQVDSKVEEMTVNQGRVANLNRVDGITKDKTLSGSQRADLMADFITKGMAADDGTIRNADMAKEVLQRALTNAASDPQGAEFLQKLGEKQLDIYGTKTTPKEYMGVEQWDVLTAQSENSRFKNDWEFNKGIQNDMLTIQSMEDTVAAETMLKQVEGRIYSAQPSNMATPEKQQVQQMREFLVNKRIQQAKTIRETTVKQIQSGNRQMVLDDVYEKKTKGENISVELDQLPTNEQTGKFTPEDLANYANDKLNTIANLPITEEEKDAKRMALLRADSTNGPFRKRVGTLISDATQEWKMAVNTGDTSNTPRLDELQKLYQSDPVTVGLLYPEQQELFMKMGLMQQAGFSKDTLAVAEAKKKDLTMQEKIDREKNWNALLNNSSNKDLSALPKQLKDTMYAAYSANIDMTGNEDAALKYVQGVLEKNYIPMKTEGVGGASDNVGVISKNFLQVDPNNVNSWTSGKEIMDTYKDDFIKSQPWVLPTDVSVVERPNGTILFKTVSGDAMIVHKEDLQNKYQELLQKAEDDRAAGVEAELKGINVRVNASDAGISSYQFPATLMSFTPIK